MEITNYWNHGCATAVGVQVDNVITKGITVTYVHKYNPGAVEPMLSVSIIHPSDAFVEKGQPPVVLPCKIVELLRERVRIQAEI